MDRILNHKDEKQTIYEIYRACRLCGAGAGYKMPIIQNVIDLDGNGIDLRQKIKECVQIEVNHTDRMPPLICELCVDKVNEFYDFLDMCKRSNKRTRLRLGLPLQARTRDLVDSQNCILGVTEPVLTESDNERSTRHKKTRIKKEPIEVNLKTDTESTKSETESSDSEGDAQPLARHSKKSRIKKLIRTKIENARPSPKPEQQKSRESSEEHRWSMTRNKKRVPSPLPKRTTRQNAEFTPQIEEPLPIEKSKLKRPRDKETKTDTPPPAKKAKTIQAPEPVKPPKPGPKSKKNTQKEPIEPPPSKTTSKLPPARPASKKDRKPSPPPKPAPKQSKALTSKELPSKALPSKALPSKALPSKALPSKALPSKATASPELSKAFYCQICNMQTKNSQGFAQHNTKHYVNFTSPKHSCNACELWFPTVEETNGHHKNHRIQNIPYKCTRCYGYFKLQQAYEEHFGKDLCLSVYEVPDVKCWECWQTFPTNKLMEDHKCAGEDGRPGGKCEKCNRSYALLKNLIKHESFCTHKKKGEVTVDPAVQARLLPMQVRVARCDPLLTAGENVSSSKVSHKYGLDSKSHYPYMSNIRVKSEPSEPLPMVTIDQDVKEEFSKSLKHWDSDSDVSNASAVTDSSQKNVDTLTTISLKTIFSKKCLGKAKSVVKTEAFDSNVDFELGEKINSIIDNLEGKIDNIICNLGDEDALTTCSYDSDSILDKNIARSSSDALKRNDKIENQNNNDKADGSRNLSPNILKDDAQTIRTGDSDSILDKNNGKGDADKVESKVSDDPSIKCEGTPKLDDLSRKCDKSPEKVDVTSEKIDGTFEKCDATSKINGSSEKMDVAPETQGETPEKCDGVTERLQIDSVPVNSETKAVNHSIENENKEGSMKESDDIQKSSAVDSDKAPNEVSMDDESIVHDDMKKSDDDNDTETLNKDSNIHIDDRNTPNNDDNKQSKVYTDATDAKLLEATNYTENAIVTNEIDLIGILDRNKHLALNNIECLKTKDIDHETNEKMDVDEQNEVTEDKTNVNAENNVNFFKINEITNKILKENFTEVSKHNDKHLTHDNDNHQKSDPRMDSISLNSMRSENGIDNKDKFNVDDLSEDDKKLMAELDAQIGENDQNLDESNQKFDENDQKDEGHDQKMGENDQKIIEKDHLIDDLLRKQDLEMRSLDLDNISDDEFNFDV